MPRATCRCGQTLTLPADGSDRIVCPHCGARIRVRRPANQATGSIEEGGFLRFDCPCGRRLKVVASAVAATRPAHVKCPDCERIVAVPVPGRDPEAPTAEMPATDAAAVEAWSARHRAAGNPVSTRDLPTAPAPFKSEAGLRVCPGCGRPVHLGSVVCRECGSHVPKR